MSTQLKSMKHLWTRAEAWQCVQERSPQFFVKRGHFPLHLCHLPYIKKDPVSHPDLKPMSNITVQKDMLLAGLGMCVSVSALTAVYTSHLAEVFWIWCVRTSTEHLNFRYCMFRSELWFWASCDCEERGCSLLSFSCLAGWRFSPKRVLVLPGEVSVKFWGALLFMNLISAGCFLLTSSSASEEHTVIVQ